jgi:hypothetical protein
MNDELARVRFKFETTPLTSMQTYTTRKLINTNKNTERITVEKK